MNEETDDAKARRRKQRREQARAVRVYLEAIEAGTPKVQRRRTPDRIRIRLDELERELESADVLTTLSIAQERIDLIEELEGLQDKTGEHSVAGEEAAFVDHAKAYGHSSGITYAAWRQIGVSPGLLARAGIDRTLHGRS